MYRFKVHHILLLQMIYHIIWILLLFYRAWHIIPIRLQYTYSLLMRIYRNIIVVLWFRMIDRQSPKAFKNTNWFINIRSTIHIIIHRLPYYTENRRWYKYRLSNDVLYVSECLSSYTNQFTLNKCIYSPLSYSRII